MTARIEWGGTPGPWSLDDQDQRDEAQAVMSDRTGGTVCDVFCGARMGECEANARGIAQVPAMVAAMRKHADLFQHWTDDELERTGAGAMDPARMIPPREARLVLQMRAILAAIDGGEA